EVVRLSSMTVSTPPLVSGLVDDAAASPVGSVTLAEAIEAHRRHRRAWYGGLVGPLLVPTSALGELIRARDLDDVDVALVADSGLDRLAEAAVALTRAGTSVHRVEAAVAKRGENPLPGLRRLLAVGEELAGVQVFAEVPLTWGLIDALDIIADAVGAQAQVAAKFRIGGLAAELFPTPAALAGVICACRDRNIRFKLSAGLQRAVRHNDPETGFTHHGVLNVLAACLTAAAGASLGVATEQVAATDAVPLVELVRAGRALSRPLWTGFSSTLPSDLLPDLRAFGLLGT
ncbi:MAG: hypothetical protein L0Y54_23675, partial [Sporichthyaceae bacterium]|nr:hypothetical protein [Sporichthyaceae bacterium]